MEAEHKGTPGPGVAPAAHTPPAWKDVVDAMPQLVWVAGADGRVWFYNQRVRDYSGPLEGPDGEWRWQPVVHVDDAAGTEAAWQHAVARVAPYACEHRIRMADGTYRWHVSRGVPVHDEHGGRTWFGTATDIHEVALAEERARRSEQRLARLIDGLFTFVGLCAPDGTLLEANETALHAGGVTREEVVGRPLWDATWFSHDPDAQGRVRGAVRRAAAGTPSRFDVEVCMTGDRLITIDLQIVPLIEDGRVTAVIPSATDITGRIAEQQRLEALATLSQQLNGVSSTGEAADLLCRLGPAVIGADFVNLAVFDEHRLALQLTLPPGHDELASRWATVPLDGLRTPLADAVATGAPVIVDRQLRAERYADTADDAERLGLLVTASMPLRDGAGEVFGAMGCGWARDLDVDAALRARLRLLADLASQSLARSQRSDVHDRLVHELQARLLFGHEPADDLDVAVGYEPAQTAIGFGGDWYDVVRVDDDVTALVVGDVAGHGIAASAEMATTKATVRATLLAAGSRADVLPLASRAVRHLQSGYVATVATAWIDVGQGTLEWRLAGHPPPVLRPPGGAARLLEGAHHPPLGMPTGPKAVATEAFPPGALLVLYTDGLVERPGIDIDERLEVLRELVDDLPDGIGAVDARDRLMVALLDESAVDDVAIVVAVRPA